MVQQKLVSFPAAALSSVDTSNFTNKPNSHTPQVEILTRQNLCHFGRYVAKAELFCLRNFRSIYPGWSVDTGKCSSCFCEILVPASEVNTSRFLLMEEWRSEISKTEPARSTGLHEELLKSVFHLSSQICGSFIQALSKTGLTNPSKQYQLLRFC